MVASNRIAQLVESISNEFIKNKWTLNDLILFMAAADIKDKDVRKYIISAVTLKTAMLELIEESK
ncbi:MAG: hypothetical protein LBP70_01425 [Mycoplasmataceae bacterium]|nr:hypothetical protein [Mycoplasmataceae bacterium]